MNFIQLRVNELQANLPLEDSQIFVLLNADDGRTPLPESLNCAPSDECVLMPEVAEISLSQTEFTIQVDNVQNPQLYELYIMAVSNSNSKVVFLGSVTIDVLQLHNCSFQNRTSLGYKKQLQQVQNQKGFITYSIQSIQPTQSTYNHFGHKSSESLDRQETSSSDSFDANLKQLNKTLDSENSTSSPNAKAQFSFYNQRNADFSQKIIVEEIDLQDSQDDVQSDAQRKNNFKSNQTIKQVQSKIMFRKQKSNSKNIKQRLREEKLKVQRYLHHLQESDHFLFRLQQKLSYFKQ